MRLGRLGVCLTTVGVYILLRIGMPMVKLHHGGLLVLLLALLSILVVWLMQVAAVVATVRLQMKLRYAVILAITGAILFVLSLFVKTKGPWVNVTVSVGRDLALMLAAVPLGYLVSFIIKEPGILLPVAVVAGIVDFWNVLVGPLGNVVANHPSVVDKASVHLPAIMPGLPSPTIGMGDIVFLAMFFSVIYRFGMNAKRSFWLGYTLLAISLFAVMRSEVGIPALVPMGVAIVLANLKEFKLKREELFATIYVSGFLIVLLVIVTFLMHRK